MKKFLTILFIIFPVVEGMDNRTDAQVNRVVCDLVSKSSFACTRNKGTESTHIAFKIFFNNTDEYMIVGIHKTIINTWLLNTLKNNCTIETATAEYDEALNAKMLDSSGCFGFTFQELPDDLSDLFESCKKEGLDLESMWSRLSEDRSEAINLFIITHGTKPLDNPLDFSEIVCNSLYPDKQIPAHKILKPLFNALADIPDNENWKATVTQLVERVWAEATEQVA